MSTDNPTIHERVTQAVSRDVELLNDVVALQDQLDAANIVENDVRAASTLDVDIEAAAEIRTSSNDTAQTEFDTAIAKAHVPFDRAQQKYNELEAAATEKHTTANDEATDLFDKTVAAVTEKQKIAEASALALVHRIKQEKRAIVSSIAQHRGVILNALGLKLDS